MSAVSKTLHEIGTSAAGDAVSEEIRNFLRGLAETEAGKKVLAAVGKKAEKLFDAEDNRVDMLNFVRGPLRGKASGIPTHNILTYLANALRNDPLGDNKVVRLLSLIFDKTRAKNPDGSLIYPDPKDDQYLLQRFMELGLLTEEEFRVELEHYDNDPAEQLLRYTGRKIQEGVATADKWLRGIIAYIATWPMVLMLGSAAGASQGEMWFISALPMIAILALVVGKKVSPTYVILGSWADQKLKLNLRSTAASIMGLHVVFGVYLGFYPIQSLNLIFLLYIASIALFFLGMGKGSLVGFGKLACYGLVIFALYANHNGITSTDTPQIEAAADTVITKVKNAVGMGPGSSQDNPIVLGVNDGDFRIKEGSSLWFKILPGGWNRSLSCTIGLELKITDFSGEVERQWYELQPNGTRKWGTIKKDSSRETLTAPKDASAVRYRAQEERVFKATASKKSS